MPKSGASKLGGEDIGLSIGGLLNDDNASQGVLGETFLKSLSWSAILLAGSATFLGILANF